MTKIEGSSDESEVLFDEEDVLEEYSGGEEGGEDIIIDATGDDGDGMPFVAELELHEGEATYCLAVHPNDPSIVASAGGNDKVVIFRTSENDMIGLQVDLLHELDGHTDTVEHVKFNHDGSLLATGSLDGTIRIWNSSNFTLLHVLEGPSEVTWIEWHPRGPVLVAGSLDGAVWMWQASNGTCLQVFSGKSTNSTCGAFTGDGKTLVTGGIGIVFVWNPKDGTAITYTGGSFPQEQAISLATHPTMPVAMVGFADGRITVIHTGHQQVLASLSTGEDSVECVGFLKDHPIMLTADLAGTIHLWDSNNYRERTVLTDPDMDGVTCHTWLSTEGHVAVGCRNGTVAIWDVRSGAKVMDFLSPAVEEEDAVYSIAEVANLRLLLASFDDGKIRIYRLS
jgi:WD40 repeat protein